MYSHQIYILNDLFIYDYITNVDNDKGNPLSDLIFKTTYVATTIDGDKIEDLFQSRSDFQNYVCIEDIELFKRLVELDCKSPRVSELITKGKVVENLIGDESDVYRWGDIKRVILALKRD